MDNYRRKTPKENSLWMLLIAASGLAIASPVSAQINLEASPGTEQVDTSEIEARLHTPRKPAYKVITSRRAYPMSDGAAASAAPPAEIVYPEPLNGPAFPQQGDVVLKALTLVIEFPNRPAMLTFGEIDNHLNEIGYDAPIEEPGLNAYRYNGSIRDYFLSVSNGAIDYQNVMADFDTATGFYLADNDFEHYDNASLAWDEAAKVLIEEALDALEAQKPAGYFEDFVDADGEIPFLNILISGFAATKDGGLWAHSNWNYGHELSNGIVISQYQIQPIVSQDNVVDWRLFNMATFAHESGHTLFHWFDLYDTDGSSWGLGLYALMAYKGYFFNPAPPVAYHRYLQNWETPVDLRDYAYGATLTLETNAYSSYIYVNPQNESEYYLIEARRKEGRSAPLTSEGLMILHVDASVQGNDCEEMTEACHYSVSLEQADGLFELENKAHDLVNDQHNDLFNPATSDHISDVTVPNTNWWDGSLSGLSLANISEVGPTMSFTYADPGVIIHSSVSPPLPQPSVELPMECQIFTGANGSTSVLSTGGDFGDFLEIGDFVYLTQDGPEYAREVIGVLYDDWLLLDSRYQGTNLVNAPCSKYELGFEDMGMISPIGYDAYDYGDDALFSTEPDPGYHLEDLIVDGESLGIRQLDYIFQNVQEQHTIEAVFGAGELPMVEIVINTTGSGTTNLGVDVRFHEGEDITVTFIPDADQRVGDVVIDGLSEGRISSYSWTDIAEGHQIDISFVPVMLGDVDGNGVVSIEDALLIAQFSAGIIPPVFIEENADVDCDGAITIEDALLVAKKYSTGLIGSFTC